jgi:hypothetical protein
MISLDPQTAQRVFAASRTVVFWYHSVKDLSGLSVRDEAGGWIDPALPPPTLAPLLREVGRLYAPFMAANARAVAAGEKDLDCVLGNGVRWVQPSFKYQSKCLRWLHQEFWAMPPDRQAVTRALLAGTGCDEHILSPLQQEAAARL